jgi:hypothetical protein
MVQHRTNKVGPGKEITGKKEDDYFSGCAARPSVPNPHHPSQVYGLIPIRFQMLIEAMTGCVFNKKENV